MIDARSQDVLVQLADIIVETAREAGPLGAPSGIIYTALMTVGISLSVYQALLSALEETGKITVSSDCVRAV